MRSSSPAMEWLGKRMCSPSTDNAGALSVRQPGQRIKTRAKSLNRPSAETGGCSRRFFMAFLRARHFWLANTALWAHIVSVKAARDGGACAEMIGNTGLAGLHVLLAGRKSR